MRKNYLFCKNYDAAEDAAVMFTFMGCCKLAGVNVQAWLTCVLDHVHGYDNDYSLDIADFLPSSLVAKGLLKTSENLRRFRERHQSLRNNDTCSPYAYSTTTWPIVLHAHIEHLSLQYFFIYAHFLIYYCC